LEKAEALQELEEDLKEAVSTLRQEEYRWAIEKARDPADLRVVEINMMKDSRLSPNQRGQLLKRLEDATYVRTPSEFRLTRQRLPIFPRAKG